MAEPESNTTSSPPEPVTTSKRLVHNTLFNVVALVSNAVIGFLLVRFFLGRLGESRYGVWLIVGSLFKYRGILGMGLNSSVNRYVPVYMAKNDPDGVQRVVSTASAFFMSMAAAGILLALVIYRNVDSWFVIRPDLLTDAGWVVLLAGGSLAFSMPLQSFSAVLSGLQRYDLLNLAELSCVILRTIMIVALLLHGYGLIAMAVVFGTSEIVMRLAQYAFVRKLLPDLSVSIKSVDLRLLREMLAYGINTFLYIAGVIIICKANEWVIGITLDTALIPQFYAVTAAVLILYQLVQGFTRAVKPAVSDLDARDDHVRIKEVAFLTQKYCLLLIIPGVCFLVVMGREFLWLWVGERFQNPVQTIDRMTTMLNILTIGLGLLFAQYSNFIVLVGRGEHKIFGILSICTALACVVAAVFSVKVLNRGLVSIAWSTFVPTALISGLILPMYFNRKMNISAREAAVRVWLLALLGSLPGVLLICIWKHLAAPDSWPEILAVVASVAVVTVAGAWFLSMESVERRRFLRVVRRRPRR
jgi:O-antigen/teichoic acid export membrane protein